MGLVEGADIEEVTDDMLEKMIVSEEKLAVLFYEENDDVSTQILESLENIDDDLVRNQFRLGLGSKALRLGSSKMRLGQLSLFYGSKTKA